MADQDPLLAAAADGDQWAWSQLHGQLAPGLRGYVLGVGGADPDAVVGEALARLARDVAAWPSTPEEVRLWAYLHARAVLSERRELRLDADKVSTDVAPTVRIALGTLDPAQREALVLRVTCGLDGEDLATVLGVTPAAAERLVTAASEALQRAMG